MGNNKNLICPRCGSKQIIKEKTSGIAVSLSIFRGTLPRAVRKRNNTHAKAVCQRCGKKWIID